MELQELQELYDNSQQERAELEEELQHCKAELEKLSDGAQVKTHNKVDEEQQNITAVLLVQRKKNYNFCVQIHK